MSTFSAKRVAGVKCHPTIAPDCAPGTCGMTDIYQGEKYDEFAFHLKSQTFVFWGMAHMIVQTM